MKSQPRLKKGHRDPLPSCVDPRVRAMVAKEAKKWDCSRSWIVAVILSDFYGIDIFKPFEKGKK